MKRASHFLSHVVHGHNAVQIVSCLLACFWLNLTELSLCAQEGAGDRSQTLVWQRSHALMLENMGFFLDGAVDVDMELGQVQWKTSEAAVFRRLERIVQEVASLQALPVPWTKGGFSDEIKALIGHVGSLDYRDLRRWRMAENLSEKEQWYVLVQSGLDELKMQLAMELPGQCRFVRVFESNVSGAGDRNLGGCRNSLVDARSGRSASFVGIGTLSGLLGRFIGRRPFGLAPAGIARLGLLDGAYFILVGRSGKAHHGIGIL